MVVATAVFTCGDASMKLVSGSLPTGECVFVRGLCSALLVGAAAVWTGAILALSQLAVAGAAFACASFERWATPSAYQLLHLICASVFSLIGHLCVIYSLRSGEISAVAPFRYVGMVWAILLGFAVWHQLPDALSFAGIVVLASAGLYTFYREQQLRRLQVLRAALPH